MVVAARRIYLGLIRTAFRAETEVTWVGEMVEHSIWNSPHRAKLEDRSATELADRAFTVSQSCPHLPRLLFYFPQRGVQHQLIGRIDFSAWET